MTRDCTCTEHHPRKRIVLTGGPGAGKTAVLELAHQFFCRHLVMVPEAASMLFRGGFPRGTSQAERAATQRAIFHVQRELENSIQAANHAAALLCDRGTVDGAAYWPGPDEFWDALDLVQAEEQARYDVVIHLRVPAPDAYNHDNEVRTETHEQAIAVDARIAEAWEGHPHRHIIESSESFLDKAHRALDILETELPACCRRPRHR